MRGLMMFAWGLGIGEKLRQLLREHGSLKQLELQVSRWAKRLQSEGKEGQWVTRAYLADVEHYTKTFG